MSKDKEISVPYGKQHIVIRADDDRLTGIIQESLQTAFVMEYTFLATEGNPDEMVDFADGISASISETALQLFANEEYREPLPLGNLFMAEEIIEHIPGIISKNIRLLHAIVFAILNGIKAQVRNRYPTYFVYFGNPEMPGFGETDEMWYDVFKAAKFNVFHVIEPDCVEESCYLAVCSSKATTPEALEAQAALSE